MNREYILDPIMQFDYLRLSLRKRKRFQNGLRKLIMMILEIVSQAFNISINKSKDAIRALTDEQLDAIKSHLKRGGNK